MKRYPFYIDSIKSILDLITPEIVYNRDYMSSFVILEPRGFPFICARIAKGLLYAVIKEVQG